MENIKFWWSTFISTALYLQSNGQAELRVDYENLFKEKLQLHAVITEHAWHCLLETSWKTHALYFQYMITYSLNHFQLLCEFYCTNNIESLTN